MEICDLSGNNKQHDYAYQGVGMRSYCTLTFYKTGVRAEQAHAPDAATRPRDLSFFEIWYLP